MNFPLLIAKTLRARNESSTILFVLNTMRVMACRDEAMYSDWLGFDATIHPVSVPDPSDYGQILVAVESVLEKLGRRSGSGKTCFIGWP